MGVRGLTTFIKNHENKYLRNYKLYNCTILIDGNSLASNLFISSRTESAFGGDYDKFAKYVKEYFKVLHKCKIKPLVIFDGGYEKQKLGAVHKRMKEKFKSAQNAHPVTGGLHFPLFMRIVFREVLTELKIPFAQSDFEADDEIAALARLLECPVLSYDSDFYIYDVLYIPSPSLCMEPMSFDKCSDNNETSENTFYLNCKIYKVDVFINSFGGLDKSMLPLLAVLLGNDYIKSSVFTAFYKHLKIPKGKTKPLQRRIKAVIKWLRNETFESAVRKIMGRMKKKSRRSTMRKVKKIVKQYVRCSSNLSEHLAIYPNDKSETDDKSAIVNIIQQIDENIDSMSDINESVDCEKDLLEENLNETESEDSADESCSSNVNKHIDENIDSISDINDPVYCEKELPVEENLLIRSEDDDEDSIDVIEDLAIPSNSECTINKESTMSSINKQIDENIDSISDINKSVVCEEGLAVEDSFSEIVNQEYDGEGDEVNSVIEEESLDIIKDEDNSTNGYPRWLLEYARKGKIQSCVMDIISLKHYFFIPQVEDVFLPFAHFISLKILSAIVGLLLRQSTPLVTYWARNGPEFKRYPIKPIITTANLIFPPSENIILLDESMRRSVLLDIAELTLDLSELPDDWQLYILAAIFWLKNMNQPAATECHLHTLVMCIVCIYTIDSQIGVHRNKQSFLRKYKKYLNKIVGDRNKTKDAMKESNTPINQWLKNEIRSPRMVLENATHEDCVMIFESILSYHHLNEQIKIKPKSFSLSIVHAFSQFQSCLYHFMVLNSVLGFPFKETIVSHMFSGTFSYNMFTNLSKRNNCNDYANVFFQSCPSLLKLYRSLVSFIQSALSGTSLCVNSLKRKRNKKRNSNKLEKKLKTDHVINENTEEREEVFIDENNRFSGLLLYD